MSIGIYIYHQAEVLDFSGPFEVFATAARLGGEASRLTPWLIGETDEIVTARGGYRVLPDYGIDDHPPLGVLIVAGGVHTAELKKTDVLTWIGREAGQCRITASVCTGAFLLAGAGALDGRRVTTHWEDIADLRTSFPALDVVEGVRWVDEGDRVTSAGISAGIDMSLHLVERLSSRDLAERTARQMAFNWTSNPGG